MDGSWTIAELAELAAEVLARPGTVGPDGLAGSVEPDGGHEGALDGALQEGQARANGRVRDVPNERLIRWYGTVGLVDPPLSRRGRVARYGRRHLLQLVAVKRRQAEGKSLAQIQTELAGAPDDVLAAVARIPALGPAQARGDNPAPAAGAGPARFWTRQPWQPDAVAPAQDSGAIAAEVPAGLVHGIRLAPGVTLLLDGADRTPGPEDLTGIMDAARPLLRALASRGLSSAGPHQQAEVDDSQTGAGYEH